MGIIVRKAKASDIPRIRRLYEGFTVAGGEESSWVRTFRVMERRRDIHLLVAEAYGVVVGTCVVYTVPSLSHGVKGMSFVEHLVVDVDWRRRGVGRLLIDECVRIAKKASSYKLFVPSTFPREDAHAFYERVGFRRRGYLFQIDL